MPKTENPKKCFVVGPIGGADTDDRIHADWLLEEIIEPVFAEDYPDWVVERADRISTPGSINEQVISALLDHDLVIADISTLNANAFYEIGIRHAVQKPAIHMHLKGQRIPFDISSFRSIEFSRTRPSDIKAARLALKKALLAVLNPTYEVNNPVTSSRGRVAFQKSATEPEKLIQGEIDGLRERVAEIERSNSKPGSAAWGVDFGGNMLTQPATDKKRVSYDLLVDDENPADPVRAAELIKEVGLQFATAVANPAKMIVYVDSNLAANVAKLQDELLKHQIRFEIKRRR